MGQSAPATHADDQVTEIVVTGTSIKRTDTETPSPIQVINSEELKQSGYTTIAQVLNNITANGQGTLSQGFSGAFAAGAQGVSLRGLNTSATLVLIDGHRVAPNPMFDDGQRSFVDIGNIPFDSIERVEVLKDGASAQYGSDAIAGVVNIILKKNVVGTTVNAEAGTATEGGGTTEHASITTGFGDLINDGYNAFLSVEFRHENPITNASRAGDGQWTNLDYSPFGGYNFTRGVPNPVIPLPVIPGSVYLYNPAGGTPSAANTAFLSGSCNSFAKLSSGGCAFATPGDIQPETKNINILASFTKKLGGDWQLAAKASVFSSQVNVESSGNGTNGLPAPFGQFINPAVGASGGIPFVVNYPNAGPITVPANYPGNTLGVPAQVEGFDTSSQDTSTLIQTREYRLALEATGSLAGWDTSTSLTLSRNNQYDSNIGTQNGEALLAALNRPTNPYNILGAGNSVTDIEAIYPRNTTNMYSELSDFEVHATRSLMQLAGGDLGFSMGAEYLYTKVNAPAPDLFQAGAIPGNTFVQFVNGEQSDTAVFAEIAAPVVKGLELDAHARFDHFAVSGTNNSFTPAFGFKWTPASEFALRGTISTGFRAPNVAETGKSGLTFAGPNDSLLCPSSTNPAPGTPVLSCLPTAVFQSGFGAPELKPEKSITGTLGVIVEPIKGWSSTLDFYDIKIKNQIYTPPPSAGLGEVRSQIPITGLCYEPGGTATCTTPGGADGLLLYYSEDYQNTNSTEVRGLELESHYTWDLGPAGKLYTGIDWSHTLSYVLSVGGASYQLAGTHGPELIGGDTANPKDRIQGTVTWSLGPVELTAIENYISGYTNDDPSYMGETGQANTCDNNLFTYSGVQFSGYASGISTFPSSFCKTKSFKTTDVTLRYKVTQQLAAHVAVNNLFNTQPPFDAATYGGTPYQYNPSLHFSGAIGRFVQAGVTFQF
jgi:iron complex outermembrane receptor protein